jgi:hypothetical protein
MRIKNKRDNGSRGNGIGTETKYPQMLSLSRKGKHSTEAASDKMPQLWAGLADYMGESRYTENQGQML